MMNYRQELRGTILQISLIKNRLAELAEIMDSDNADTDALDEALAALDDAIDILEDSLDEQ